LLKGQLRAEADDLDNARTYYNRAISVNPFCQKAYTGLAEALKAHSLFDEGITLLNTAIEYSPEFAEGYKLRGAMKREKGDEAGAVEDLKKALELEPKEQEGINGSFKSIQEDTEEKYKNINPFGI
jgi:tetratricopeptide (TPR) repeat protein